MLRLVRIVTIVGAALAAVAAWSESSRAQAPQTTPRASTASAPPAAQSPAPSAAGLVKVPEPERLDDLAAAFRYVTWDSTANGVLLAVAPEAYTWTGSVSPVASGNVPAPTGDSDAIVTQPLFAPTGRYGLNAGFVARHFNTRLIHLPTVTVFAPPTMTVMNRDMKPADPLIGLPLQQRFARLEATLTPAEWRALGSPDGLGNGDLSPSQQPLFDALMPRQGLLRQSRFVDPVAGVAGDPSAELPDIALDDAHVELIRLRLDRVATFHLVSAKGGSGLPNPFHAEPDGSTTLRWAENLDDAVSAPGLYGQLPSDDIPNRLKPSDLDLTEPALKAMVSLAGVRTVGDLLKAVRQASGLDVYVDGRLARLGVSVSGGAAPTVRASDLLDALRWALSATFRKLGPTPDDAKNIAYVLTFDRDGLGQIRMEQARWATLAQMQQLTAEAKYSRKIAMEHPDQYLRFPSGNLLDPTPQALSAYADGLGKPDSTEDTTIPVSTLTAAQRQQLDIGLLAIAKARQGDSAAASDVPVADRVGMRLLQSLTYVIPGVGEVRGAVTTLDDSTAPGAFVKADAHRPAATASDLLAAARPVSGRNVIVIAAAPADAAAARQLAAAAGVRGLKQLWLSVPKDPTGTDIVAAAVATGRVAHVSVGVVIDLLRESAEDIPAELQDVDILGETGSQLNVQLTKLTGGVDIGENGAWMRAIPGDVVNPSISGSLRWLTARILPAAVPGLASVAYQDACPPGYEGVRDTEGAAALDSFGYTLANRLAFLRAKGYDPIDLTPSGSALGLEAVLESTRLPLFDGRIGGDDTTGDSHGSTSAVSPDEEWARFLSDQLLRTLQSLRGELLTRNPTLQIYTSRGFNVLTGDAEPFRLWSRADAAPIADLDAAALVKDARLRRTVIPQITYQPVDTSPRLPGNHKHDLVPGTILPTAAQALALQLRRELNADSGTNGAAMSVVLDLSRVSVADAISLIRDVFVPAQ